MNFSDPELSKKQVKYIRTTAWSMMISLTGFAGLVAYIRFAPRDHFARFIASIGAPEDFPGQSDTLLVFILACLAGIMIVSFLCFLSVGLSYWAESTLREMIEKERAKLPEENPE